MMFSKILNLRAVLSEMKMVKNFRLTNSIL